MLSHSCVPRATLQKYTGAAGGTGGPRTVIAIVSDYGGRAQAKSLTPATVRAKRIPYMERRHLFRDTMSFHVFSFADTMKCASQEARGRGTKFITQGEVEHLW